MLRHEPFVMYDAHMFPICIVLCLCLIQCYFVKSISIQYLGVLASCLEKFFLSAKLHTMELNFLLAF